MLLKITDTRERKKGLERRFSETISVDRKGRRRDSVFINDGFNIFTFERSGDIPFFHAINDLNLVDHLKAFKRRKV
jgi:hypothetical protein